MTIEVVFFDAGETLLRPEPSFPERVADVLNRRGHEVSPDAVVAGGREVSHHFRSAAERGWVFSASADESRAFWTAFYRDLLVELRIDDDGAPVRLYETFSDPASYGLFEDAVPALDALAAAGRRLGIISNFEGWLRELLRRLGILDRFEIVAISGDLVCEKPDPRIFKWALEEAGTDASRCAHVGDQPYFDAAPAAACGMHGIVLDRYARWGDVTEHPKITSLLELPDLVEELGR